MYSLRYFLAVFLAAAAWAQYVPNQYIVEYEDGAESLGRLEKSFTGRGLNVKARMTRVARAMVVEGAQTREQLRALPGVKKVHRVRTFKMSLDKAASIHGLEAAWRQVPRENAGAGVKIGIIDSGIELTHPGFRDNGYSMPEGYPRFSAGHEAFTNAKVIVARSYANLWARRDSNNTPLDRIGHGTAVAMAAAGIVHESPMGSISGMAPGAYLGVYKVFGSPGLNEGATDAALLQAIEDAVNDGMDIINLSLGTLFAPRPEDDIIVQALERASAAGVIAVVAAGNDGPGFATLSSPATAPNALSVGANENGRVFHSALVAGDLRFAATTGSRTANSGTLNGGLVSISAIDPSELACSLLPSGSFTGKIVLIQRGSCTFEQKLLYAAFAGASAAVVYSGPTQPEDLFTMSAGRATIPAVMVKYADGLRLKQRLSEAAETPVTLSLALQPFASDEKRLATFSSQGPLPGIALKPDLIAVGGNVLTAAQSNTSSGAVYSSTGYTVINGTSFSSPIVAGTLAVVKQQRPGLTPSQYRSLLIQGSKPIDALPLAQQGAGILNIEGALHSTVLLDRSNISFDENVETITAATDEAFAADLEIRKGAAPQLTVNEKQIQLMLDLAALPNGTHEGFLVLRSAGGSTARVPYWYGKPETTAASIQVLDAVSSATASTAQRDVILFRVLDTNGLSLLERPQVRVVSGMAEVREISARPEDALGAWGIEVVLARGTNVFEIEAPGGLTQRFSIVGF
jgi:subtilisin family serine protease